MKKSKTTKRVKAIDKIIKFQIDDGIESLSIDGKQELADVAIDSKGNVTLFLNADKDKIETVMSSAPFLTVTEKVNGTTKTVEIAQDLAKFNFNIINDDGLVNVGKFFDEIVLNLSPLVTELKLMNQKIESLDLFIEGITRNPEVFEFFNGALQYAKHDELVELRNEVEKLKNNGGN